MKGLSAVEQSGHRISHLRIRGHLRHFPKFVDAYPWQLWVTGKIRARGFREHLPAPEAFAWSIVAICIYLGHAGRILRPSFSFGLVQLLLEFVSTRPPGLHLRP